LGVLTLAFLVVWLVLVSAYFRAESSLG